MTNQKIIENIKNHNFDNGNFIISEGVEVSFDVDFHVFNLQLPSEIVELESLEEFDFELYL